ncbi:YrhB domain-containing protein [Oleisolibacter albus]|uniref:YrhB domain-containing protein n=1 Tax=Oleisolibacter albus TaxID=2171757 RepID=UPI000DF325B3|nr:YrhB domain-containing protein [Oleisolibacter albus]
MLDFTAARALALRLIAERQSETTGPLLLLEQQVVTFEEGWLFPYQSAWYAEGGDEDAALSGHGPLFIRRTGRWFEVPAYYESGEFLARLGIR